MRLSSVFARGFLWKCRVLIPALCLAAVALAGTAWAGAYDQLLDAAGDVPVYIPPVGDPQRVDGYESSGSQDSGDEQEWINYQQEQQRDLERQRREQEKFRKKQKAFQLNEKGNRAYEKKDWARAIDLYKKALKLSPDDKVIQENLRYAEQEKKRQEELRKQRSDYRKRMKKLIPVMPVPKPLSHAAQARAKIPLPGLSPDRWNEYLGAQETVERLYAKRIREGALSDADSQAFYSALRKRNELWVDAIQKPLSPAERDKLRMDLPCSVNRNLLSLSSIMGMLEQADGRDKPPPRPMAMDRRAALPVNGRSPAADPITTAFAADFAAEKAVGLLQGAAADAVEEAGGKAVRNTYERLLGIGRIAVRAWKGGASAAGAETADLVVSRMPEPMSARAEMAVKGGRLYSKVAYQALNKFMTEAMAATGRSFDPDAFWTRFNKDLAESKKGVKAWIRFGE
ncbi:MAG: hypothetical protein JRI97_06200 [Deltaproteobacteria bacterium]|nr:hypothetical protein [Deltaproteobacteria bacterium]